MRLLTIGLLCSQLLIATTNAAEEQMHYVHGETEKRPSTVFRMPQYYSLENPETVGVFINLFPDAGFSGEEIAGGIERLFAKEGIKSYIVSYFVSEANSRNTEVTFFLKGQAYSGFTADELVDGIAQMVNYHLAEQRMLEIEDRFNN